MIWYEKGDTRVSLMVTEYSIGLQSGHSLVPVLCLVLAEEHGEWLPPLVDVLLRGRVTNF